jgi:hypothetical protein
MKYGLAASLFLAAIAMLAQRGGFRPSAPPMNYAAQAEFHFIRLEYTDLPQYHRGYGYSSRDGLGSGWWMMDWPDAEQHFTQGVLRLTRIAAGEPRHFRLTDDRIFDYPWIYATQTAWWDLSDRETARLREYLLRGGFLVVDDMWGPEQWELFRHTMARVFPNKPIVDILDSDAVMHVLYDIEEKDRTIIPGSRHLRMGYDGTVQLVYPGGSVPAWRAIHDDRQRMVVAVNFNTDVADAWEFADAPFYPEKMTALAYRFGINYVVYAMTH